MKLRSIQTDPEASWLRCEITAGASSAVRALASVLDVPPSERLCLGLTSELFCSRFIVQFEIMMEPNNHHLELEVLGASYTGRPTEIKAISLNDAEAGWD